MRCPYCAQPDTQVIDSRELEEGIVTRRRRRCVACQNRFTTYERAEAVPLMVAKKDGRREPYSRDKLMRNTLKALEKRPVPQEQVDLFIRRVEQQLFDVGKPEVSTQQIGQYVLAGLKELDAVAYIRFASVYMGFADLEAMQREIDALMSQRG
jgi:transcriptional repressor NrdR